MLGLTLSKDILQHIPESQKGFTKKLIHTLVNLQQANYVIDLGFVDPAEAQIIMQLASKYQVKVTFDSKTLSCERQHIILGDGEISECLILRGSYNSKFNQLEHRHVLGTVINSELDFQQIGDIKVAEDYFEIFCTQKIKAQLIDEFMYINKAKIRYEEICNSGIASQVLEPQIIIVSSLRLDNIVKVMIKKARSKSQKMIKNKDVKVNYVEITNPNYSLKLEDLISVRRYGRKRIIAIEQTRSGKYKLTIE